MERFKKDKTRYTNALIISVVLHVFFFTYYIKEHNELEKSSIASTKYEKVQSFQLDSVKIITKKQLQEIKDSQKRQIVANELNGKKERSANSRFAGEADQTFDRQTIAARNGAFKSAGLGSKQGNGLEKQIASTESLKPRLKEIEVKAKRNTLKSLTLNDLGSIQIPKTEETANEKPQLQANSNNAKKADKVSSLGSEKGDALSQGLAQNNDYVEDIPLGDMTNLNTTEFKYYGFYHRIRQRLEQYWGSSIQSKAKNLYKTGRRLPASENLITAVQVVLDDRGRIVEIKIEGTSGIRELDQAAVESFNKAGPFPNPPKGLLVDGRAIIQWGFVVKS